MLCGRPPPAAAAGKIHLSLHVPPISLHLSFTHSPVSLTRAAHLRHSCVRGIRSPDYPSSNISSAYLHTMARVKPPGKRKRASADEESSQSSSSELAPQFLSLLSRSLVLHTGAHQAMRDTFISAISVLPFTLADSVRYLQPLAAVQGMTPPFPLSGGPTTKLFLAPRYPPLRSLSLSNAVRAWVLADLLCLTDACTQLEEDISQRYAEDPAAAASWRDALTVPGYPACDTLWVKVSGRYERLRKQWGATDPLPAAFGAVPSAAQRGKLLLEWQRAASLCVFSPFTDESGDMTALEELVAPTISAAMRYCTDVVVVEAAVTALNCFVSDACLDGYAPALARFVNRGALVTDVCSLLCHLCGKEDQQATLVASGILPPLVSALVRHADDEDVVGDVVTAICRLLDKRPDFLSPAVAAGLVAPLLQACVRHSDSRDITVSVLQLLDSVGTAGGGCPAAIAAAGGIFTLLDCLERYASDAEVVVKFAMRSITSGNLKLGQPLLPRPMDFNC